MARGRVEPFGGAPKRSTFPPLRTAETACERACGFPVDTIAKSAPSPVSAFTPFATSSSAGLKVLWAPILFAASSLTFRTSLPNRGPVPMLRRSWIWVSPTGPRPAISTLSPRCGLASFSALRQHAVGSRSAASSKLTESGSLVTAPLVTLYSGTRKYSASPHGSKFVFLKESHIVWSPRWQR